MTDNDIVARLVQRVVELTQERDMARRDACEFGAMLETDANPNYNPESGDFAKIAMRIAYSKGWDCWRDYENKIPMIDNDIVARLNRILSGSDERGLDETECRAIRDAICEIEQLRQERDDAWLRNGRILNEIDCRIQHGAESNGHLEGIYELFKGKP